MNHFKTNYDKVQTVGMYSSEKQKVFIDNIINKYHTHNPSSIIISDLTDNLHKILSNIPCKKASNSDFIGKNYPWFYKGHSSCSNFTISSPKKICPFGFPILNLSQVDKTIKLLLILDPNTFNPKDHLNYRFLNKRNATIHYYYEYLNNINNQKSKEWCNITNILNELNQSQSTLNISLEPQLDYRKISIKISQQSQDLNTNFSILLIGGYDDVDLNFNRRLTITNSCIRPEGVSDVTLLPITPTYNCLVFEDSHYLINQELLSSALEYKNLDSAILLMKLWLERDESNSTLINQFPYDLVMAHVCISRKLSVNASNYQIFSSTINFIANYKFNSVYTYGLNSTTDKSGTDYARLMIDLPILLDSYGYNLLWRCLIGFSGLIIRCQEALSQQFLYIEDNTYLTKSLFVNKIPLCIRFSYIAQLHINSDDSDKLKLYNDKYEDINITSNICGLTDAEISSISAKSILKLALVDRLDNIDFITTCDGSVKLLLNFNNVKRKVDKGVLSSGDLAIQYSKFWHGLVETRIFAGHQPYLCIVPHNIPKSKDNPNASIIMYILESNNISVTPVIDYENIYISLNDELQTHIMEAGTSFELITSILFSLHDKNMPLRVSRVTLLDNVSYSHIDYWLPFVIYVQLESSSAWPKDDTAIKYVTTAFYLSLYKEILAHPEFKAINCKKVIIPTWRHLEITLGNIRYNLIIDGIGNDIARVNRLEAIKAISHKESSFGPAVKLVKEWAAVNFIPDTDELIEALGIHVYNTNKPKSISCGFYGIIDMLCNFEWSTYTLIVHLDGSNSKITDKQDSQPISIYIDDYKIITPNPYLISILLPLASNTLECNNQENNVNKDFTIVLKNPYNINADKCEAQFVVNSFVQTLKDKFPYLILLYNPISINGIQESVLKSNIQKCTDLKIYCKINPLCILTMSIPYLAITNNEGLISVNIAQIISELIAIGTDIIKDIIF